MFIRWLKIESKVKRTIFTKNDALFVGLKFVVVFIAIIPNVENKLVLCQISQAFGKCIVLSGYDTSVCIAD